MCHHAVKSRNAHGGRADGPTKPWAIRVLLERATRDDPSGANAVKVTSIASEFSRNARGSCFWSCVPNVRDVEAFGGAAHGFPLQDLPFGEELG